MLAQGCQHNQMQDARFDTFWYNEQTGAQSCVGARLESMHLCTSCIAAHDMRCRSPSDTGPFVLRALAPHALQLEQLPSVYGLMHGGQWVGSSAGGSRAQPTWASNPQFLLTCPREATALVCLQRPDVCNSLLQQPFEPSGCISLTACRPDAAAGGRVGTPAVAAAATAAAAAAAVAASKVVGSSGYSSMERTALLLRLQPDTPYVLVPSTAEPGVCATCKLCCTPR